MSQIAEHFVPSSPDFVWDWCSRPGAVVRLAPKFVPMTPIEEPKRLSDGTTVYSLPAGLKWISRYNLVDYIPGQRFSNVCIKAPLKALSKWRDTVTLTAQDGGTLIEEEIHTNLPSSSVQSLLAYRQHQLAQDLTTLQALGPLNANPKVIAMTGTNGLVGRSLRALLTTSGHRVISLVRKEQEPAVTQGAVNRTAADQRLWDPISPAWDLLEGVDCLVHLAGEPLMGRFHEDHRKAIRSSRIGPTTALARRAAASSTCTTMVCASAIGFYGHEPSETPLDESAPKGTGFLADMTAEWEDACTPARDAGVRVVNIRTGVTLSSWGGSLPIVRTLFSTGLGGHIGDGEHRMSWISLDDLTDIYRLAILSESMNGPINAVAPSPITHREFSRALGEQMGRPAIIPIPSFGPKLLLGSQGAQELVLADHNVCSSVLTHEFRHPTIDLALAHELGGENFRNA
ncbi:TIGR01777 family oxidoreductase [Corynebacterium freiburgense]|uniref:TIGR01777 family oxidoreductase n=1 Tax=Corynebacterium freiburgense TaxID=556548 RepID=UPI00040AE844|nr:TIGR01777 family oxidoreductase [Corynebacterium freiburgense]WJZ02786.1 Epimerase family protein [Corynebacterium freiburgense]